MQGELPTTDLGVQEQQTQATQQTQQPTAVPDLSQLSGFLSKQTGQEAPKEAVETPEVMPRLEVAEYHSEEVGGVLHTLNFLMPNVDLPRAFGAAIEEGDSSLIDVNYLHDVFGDDPAIEHVIRTLAGVADAYGETSASTYDEVFESVGGKEQWAGIRDFFNSNATEAELALAKRLTTSRNPEEIRQGAEFVVAFAQRAGATSKVPKSISTGAGTQGGAGLSEADFIEAYNELRNSPEWDRNPQAVDAAVAELDRLRAIGIRNGL